MSAGVSGTSASVAAADLSIRTLWIGATVYPDVLCVSCHVRGLPVFDAVPLQDESGDCIYGCSVVRCVVVRGEVRYAVKIGSAQIVELRLTALADGFRLRGAAGLRLVRPAPAADACGALHFSAHGQTVVSLTDSRTGLLVRVFDRPGDVLTARFPTSVQAFPLLSARDTLMALFGAMPFAGVRADWTCAADATPAHREAFARVLAFIRTRRVGDWCVRGEPGWFVMLARRRGAGWCVAVLNAGTARVLAVRLEDLVLAMPACEQTPCWRVELRRDPIAGEAAPIVRETFGPVGWDTRVRFAVAPSGGAVLFFSPMDASMSEGDQPGVRVI